MADFPAPPYPSRISAPEVIDPMLIFQSDQSYSVRRARTSHPRRRWTLSYLGKTVDEMRRIRDFLQQQRLGVFDFVWQHTTAVDVAVVQPTTPVTVQWRHGLYTGMYIAVQSSPNPSINNNAWPITRIDGSQVTLNGTTAAGIAGNANVWVYVPHAIGIFQDDTVASPETLIGPEQIPSANRRGGIFSFSVTIEEIF